MMIHYCVLLFLTCITFIPVNTQVIDVTSNDIHIVLSSKEDVTTTFYNAPTMEEKVKENQQASDPKTFTEEKVKVQLYYECMCPHCRTFDSAHFNSTVAKLADYLDIYLYPFGNAKIVINGSTINFECQHGPPECYGNKLHACAIDYLGNITKAVFFNSCMLDYSQANEGSDDEAANTCGQLMNIDTTEIKQCAKGPKGTQLLKYYGEESKKAGFKHVPYILINGKQNDGDKFMDDVCAAFANPPSPCQKSINIV